MTVVISRGVQIKVLTSFSERLGGAITRPLKRGQGLLFIPGGSVHTWFMKQSLDIVFLSAKGSILRQRENIPPWRWVLAPHKTRFTLELMPGTIKELQLKEGECFDLNGFANE
ncbi:DUF192 domain-containing protein [Amphritea balenae]|uniref:DUF192 domain-containing protein n=1 Tax=Amphritea balenae TaxID=452629 RepID=A0A3P1SPM1_9GAMM|nr:DUF192 domain-containing protein [Amphritea balenae]RRC98595.1 DUF192 domain-containing protein [Amphritea balenae]GGK65822.1 hypothetical protein GCM10007941_15010 [Amphritea balenae]